MPSPTHEEPYGNAAWITIIGDIYTATQTTPTIPAHIIADVGASHVPNPIIKPRVGAVLGARTLHGEMSSP
jgi:hypothetical protein